MNGPLKTDIDLQPLFRKLGHQLEEIRVRALRNVQSKLDHHIICDADLVQEKHLLIRLLEWFNFPTCPHQDEVMTLLARLAKHSSAAQLLQDIGGVEFLTQLRVNCDQALHPLIDQVLEYMMRLPDSAEQTHTSQCIYQQNSITRSHPSPDLPQPHTHTHRTSYRQEYDSARYQTSDTSEDTVMGYFTPDQVGQFAGQVAGVTREQLDRDISGCIKFSTFPWLPLTPTDRHVMSSTENSLHSGDQTMVISACEFLSDVVFLDFPAEVFLQRPSIVKILLQLLQVPSETSGVVTAAVKTLRDLCVHLQHRIHFYQDPTLYTPKIDFGASPPSSVASPSNQTLNSSDTRPSVIGRSDTRNQGDGQDRDTSPSDSSRPVSPQEDQDTGNHQQEDTDVDEMDALQFSQLTLPQCCLRTLTRAVPLLRTDRTDTLVEVALLMDESLDVLGLSLTGQVWTDGSITARDMVEKLQEFLQILGEVSSYHHHQSGTSGDKEQHRLGFLVVSVFLHKFLKLLVPVEQAQAVISEHLSQSVSWIVFDEALSQSLPALRPAFLPYLEAVDGESYQRFLQAETIVMSMQKTCQFLLNCQNRCDQDATELIQIAEDSLPSLPYHCNLTLVEEYVRLCSDVCSPVNASPLVMTNSRKVLLEVLAHSMVEVKLRAYSVCLALVKETLHIDGPGKPSSCQKILFLLDRHVLYEICCFGMDDANERVSAVAQQIVLYLLQSQLLMPDHIWSRLMQIVAAIMPILQGYAGLQSPLGSSIRSLCEVTPSPVKGTLPKLERFRGVLRMMFSKDVRTRAEALSKLAWFLSDEEDSEKKLPVFTELDVAGLSDLYVIREPRYLEDSDETGRSVFQVDSMMKVVNILRSPSVDIGVKKSALDQLAIMLQDTSLHKVFREEGGLEMVLGSMKTAVLKENSTAQFSETIFLPACVTLLRHLVHADYHLRHQLAHESQTYYMIVRASILHNKNDQVHYNASHLLLLLLFDEVASIDVWSVAVDSSPKKSIQCFSLPAFMAHRYHIPFKPITHHVISQHRIDLVPSTDPLQTGPPAEMLKIAWNVAWHGDMESLMVDLRKKKEEEKETEFSAKLHLTPADRAILETTHLISAIQQCLYSMCNATSHSEVSQALGRLKTYMTVSRVHGLGAEILYRLKWREAIGRYLQVIPASSSDESLLMEILSFLNLLLEAGPVPQAEQVWLGDLLVKKKGALPNMISLQDGRQQDGEGDHVDDITRLLRKEVLCFVRRFVNRLPQVIAKTSLKTWLRGDIVRSLLLRLNLADAPQFYNLPSLESTLPCLTNVTARPGWSSGCKDTDSSTLCLQLLNCLLEVLSAFHIGRGGMSMSYMGRGVTRNATLCLRHLAYEMSDQSTEEDWPKCWLFTKQLPEHPSTDPAYNWLIPLWTYRDPEVRAAGLGIAVALTSTEAGRITMTTHCQQLIGGVWGAAFSVLLDHYECSMVRQQAALLLVNLTSDTMPSGSVELGANIWQGPVITSPQNQVALVGTSALMALLHHSHFYQEMVVLLSSYYPYITVHPIKVASNSPGQVSTASQSTLTTSESGTPVPGVATQFGRPAAHAVVVEQADSSPSQHSSHHDSPVTGSSGQPADSSSPSTYLSRGSAGDYQSIATPSLVSAVSQLLTNLVVLMPQDTLDCLKKEGLLRALVSLTDPDLLAVYTRDMQQSKTPSSSSSSSSGSSEDEGMLRQLVILAGLVEMYTSILQLVTHCCELDTEVREEILQEAVILDGTLRLLGHNITDPIVIEKCQALQTSVYNFLISLLQHSGQQGFLNIAQGCVKQWDILGGSLAKIFTGSPSEVQDAALNFTTVLLCEEGKIQESSVKKLGHKKSILSMLDKTGGKNEKGEDSPTSGAILSQALIKLYDTVVVKNITVHLEARTRHISVALRSLLSQCATAKMAALDAGLMEILVEHLRKLHNQLNMESLQIGKVASGRKKDDPLLESMVLTLELLRSFMHSQAEVKTAAQLSGLSSVLHQMWGWCHVDQALMKAVLHVLANYTAKCPAGNKQLMEMWLRVYYNTYFGFTRLVKTFNKSQLEAVKAVPECKLLLESDAPYFHAQNIRASTPYLLFETAEIIAEVRGVEVRHILDVTVTNAASSLALTSALSSVDLPNAKPQHNNNSLVHCLLKLTTRECERLSKTSLSMVRTLFAILSNIVLSSECRGIMWKSNFFHRFSSLCPLKPSKTKVQQALDVMWLDLLVNLSFTTDGQQMILKMGDSLALLLEFCESEHSQAASSALMILRNMCHHSANKPKILGNEKVVPCLLKYLETNLDVGDATVAMSALWALVYNNQKAKATLKNSNMLRKLQKAYSTVQTKGCGNQWREQQQGYMEAILSTIEE